MIHDPLCRWDETSGSSEGLSKYPCDCDVIRRAREDIMASNPDNPVDTAYRLGRLDAAAAVGALTARYIESEWRVLLTEAVVAAKGSA